MTQCSEIYCNRPENKIHTHILIDMQKASNKIGDSILSKLSAWQKFWGIPGRWKTDGIRLIGGDQTHYEETTWKKWIDPEKLRTQGKYSSRRELHPQSQAPNTALWRHDAPGLKNALRLEEKQRRAWSNFWESEEENRNAALLGRQRPWISHWMNEHQVDGDRAGRKAGKSQPAPPFLPVHILMGIQLPWSPPH